MLLANFNRKEHLRHRAVSLRQHGFLVEIGTGKVPAHVLKSSRRMEGETILIINHNTPKGRHHLFY